MRALVARQQLGGVHGAEELRPLGVGGRGGQGGGGITGPDGGQRDRRIGGTGQRQRGSRVRVRAVVARRLPAPGGDHRAGAGRKAGRGRGRRGSEDLGHRRGRRHRHLLRLRLGLHRDVADLLAGALEEVLEDRAAAGGDATHHTGAEDRSVHAEAGRELRGQDGGHGTARHLRHAHVEPLLRRVLRRAFRRVLRRPADIRLPTHLRLLPPFSPCRLHYRFAHESRESHEKGTYVRRK
ncbi:hypothetical protein FH965_29120 [Streptomyces spectabilis]|uniref:Uncharacterized protein n=1 Tax=Streptomyces spectabilis TaxID=68270 RepID=A0A516RER4_STRST|nr:hypothetical protein FH965_29120 [Streptomyces spectabilis]